MESNAREFKQIFSKISFSPNIYNLLGEAYVNKIKVNKASKILDVYIDSPKIVNEKHLDELNDKLLTQFPTIEHVNVHLSYNLAEKSLEKLIDMHWENIVFQIGKESPLCYKALNEGKWQVINENIIITLKNNASFFFLKRNIDKSIQSILEKQLNVRVSVVFKDEKMSEKLIIKSVKEKDKTPDETLDKTIIEKPLIEKPRQKPKNNDFFSGDFRGRSMKGRKKTKLNMELSGEITKLEENLKVDSEILVEGIIISVETRETKAGNLLTIMDMTDKTNSITIKFFTSKEEYAPFKDIIIKDENLIVRGRVVFDEFSKELVVMANEIGKSVKDPEEKDQNRMDNSLEKRVELHLHTQMSSTDGVTHVGDYIKRAIEWGHKAIAITDHGVVQAFPDAMNCSKGKDIKIIYGVEAYLLDDLGAKNQTLSHVFTIFDLETTGLSKEKDKITEIGAVKISNGKIVDKFSSFVNPECVIPQKITELTGINNQMVKDAPTIDNILPQFLEFAGDTVFVAHNASFDMGFITYNAVKLGIELNNTILDTLELSRTLFPQLSNHKLNIVASHLGVGLENHHRAADDALATAEIFIKCSEILKEKGLHTLAEVNALASCNINLNKLKHHHAIILAKNYTGLKNLYELISKAHIDYFYKRPRIPKSQFSKLREGLLIGTACEAGEFYKAVKDNKPDEYIKQLAEYYDYLEIQPIENNMYLVRDGKLNSVQDLININKKIVLLGEKYNKPVVATCDVHFLDKEDEVFRRIIMAGEGFKDADNQAPLYFKTTEEMLKEFEYLGSEKAKEVVVTNTNLIADKIENIIPIPDGTFPPFIQGAEEELRSITLAKAKEIYGEDLPKLVDDRLERELNSIIKNGFAVMYIIAQKLVRKSMEDGYSVGSRGSVGSSFVATMSCVTEVNPLPPHYICPSCKYSDFDSEEVKQFAGASGCDMPDKLCPICKAKLSKDGHDIPFETFLGFDGEKEPDIDLNFSGEYQSQIHSYTETLFGNGNVFKAGTISTLAEKTAFGYVRKYLDERGIVTRNAEINRLKIGCTGVKKTTGQHPGGLMILPEGHSIYEFCPVQRPANDTKSLVTTTHFDYHSISGRLLKLDLLGHDAPTMFRMLHDITGIDPKNVDLGDKKIMSLFISTELLGVSLDEINVKTGTLGLPEFGTNFVRGMLLDTMPNTFSELARISGLSHGTDVWLNNAQDLVRDGVATLKEIIPTRDDIMVYLINKGVERMAAFKIMENVRRGKGLKDDEVDIMEEADVPKWYIESCRKIKYMFPKGHAIAYVMASVRIGFYKIHHPYSFYAATFSVKPEMFDYELMCFGKDKVLAEIKELNQLGRDISAKDKSTLTILELVYEMYKRGLQFAPLDLYNSEVTKFRVLKEGLLPPLCAVQGLGGAVAQNIVDARKNGEFITIEDFRNRTKANKTVIELLKKNDIFNGLSDSNQLSLF